MKNKFEKPYFKRVRDFPPTFLSEFDTKHIEFKDLGFKGCSQDYQPEYVCRQLVCKCGEEKLELLVSKAKNTFLKRMFTGKKDAEQPLVVVFCPSCELSNVVFDQRLHGWDAMFDVVAKFDDGEPQKVNNKGPHRVYLGLSYYWLNDFERVFSENRKIGADLENYIDHIDFFVASKKNAELVFGFTCSLAENYEYGD